MFGVLLVAAGVTAATLFDDAAARRMPMVGGEYVLAADLHVHALVGDGGLPPWELAREARRRRLDVIVVSNHNQMLAARLAAPRAPSAPGDVIVLPAQELTTPGFHMIAAGIRRTVDWRLSASQAIAEIHRQGGVAIAAHPAADSWTTTDDASLRLLDGAEVAHPVAAGSPGRGLQLAAFFDRAAAVNPSLAPIGSSDFHFGGSLGECRTFIFAAEPTAEGVLDAIRRGTTVASDGRGHLTGEAGRVSAVGSLLAANPAPLRASWLLRVSGYLALAGVLLMLLFKIKWPAGVSSSRPIRDSGFASSGPGF